MPTTTNYGWTTPADTDLVKDGAAAIRTLGNSVDTTTKNLNPETTLGDISYRSSTANTNTRLPIGTTGQVLTVVGGVPAWSSETGDITEVQGGTGISVTSGTGPIPTVAIDSTVATLAGTQTLTNKTIALGSNTVSGTTAQFNTALTDGDFATLAGTETLTNKTLTSPVLTTPTISTIDAKGDLLAGTADNTIARLAVGANDTVLTADSSTATGLKWAAPTSGSLTVLESGSLTGSSVTTAALSTSYKDLRVVFRNYKPATDGADLLIRFNEDTGTNYTDRTVSGDFGFTRTSHNENFVLQDNTLAEGLATVEVPDYANTTTRKVLWRKFQSANLSSNTANMYMIAPNISTYNSTSAITKLTFFPSSGNFTSGDYIVYGVK